MGEHIKIRITSPSYSYELVYQYMKIQLSYNMEGYFMEKWLIILICFIILIVLIVIHCIMGVRHPIRSALVSLIPGPVALGCVNLLSIYTGVFIPLSPLTLSVSSVLGIPGVTSLLILRQIL